MNYSNFIGELSLNITTFIYCIWQIPQIIKNIKTRNDNLSFATHALLVLGYLFDLIYGFGENLPFQYKMVTIFCLICLSIEHYQFWIYLKYTKYSKKKFILFTLCLILITEIALSQLAITTYTKNYYDVCGFISWLCWLNFLWPQLYKNYLVKNVNGISKLTANLSLITGIGDIISAFALSWPFVSKLSSSLILIPKIILLIQFKIFSRPINIHISQ